ncbi:cysteine desulfurase NifS, partial [Staphylococcus aureus]
GLAAQAEWARLRERLWQIIEPVGGLMRNGRAENTAAPFLSVSVAGVHGAALIAGLNEGEPALAVSAGAACSAAKGESSHVVRA